MQRKEYEECAAFHFLTERYLYHQPSDHEEEGYQLIPRRHVGKSLERLRLEWECYRALHNLFLQTDDSLVLSAHGTGSILVPAPYDRVALVHEVHPEWIFAYRCHGKPQPCPPAPSDVAYPYTCARVEYERTQRASVVHTAWIMSHLFLDPARNADASLDHGVALVQRAAMTLAWNAQRFRATALALAQHMRVVEAVLALDAYADGGAPLMMMMRPNVFRDDGTPFTKSPARLAFERRVCRVFDWRVTMPYGNFSSHLSDVVISVAGLRREWSQTTPDERVGAVLLRHTMDELVEPEGRTEEALVQMLMAARGLDAASHELADAVAAFKSTGLS